jgi:hypothetical protein
MDAAANSKDLSSSFIESATVAVSDKAALPSGEPGKTKAAKIIKKPTWKISEIKWAYRAEYFEPCFGKCEASGDSFGGGFGVKVGVGPVGNICRVSKGIRKET